MFWVHHNSVHLYICLEVEISYNVVSLSQNTADLFPRAFEERTFHSF